MHVGICERQFRERKCKKLKTKNLRSRIPYQVERTVVPIAY